jgi:transcriptional regulator with XRE-family HTH domain
MGEEDDFENFKRAFGERIRGRRKELGMSQEDFAEIAKVDRKHVSSIETGKAEPGIWTVMRIAGALQISVAVLTVGLDWVPDEFLPGQPGLQDC